MLDIWENLLYFLSYKTRLEIHNEFIFTIKNKNHLVVQESLAQEYKYRVLSGPIRF